MFNHFHNTLVVEDILKLYHTFWTSNFFDNSLVNVKEHSTIVVNENATEDNRM